MGKTPPEPKYGWCTTRHRQKKAAQSGHVIQGKRYCKECYRSLCPEGYAAKQDKRRKACQLCGQLRELVGDVCRPCIRSKSCKCKKLPPPGSVDCCLCSKHVAVWCRDCYSEDVVASGLCATCFSAQTACQYCGELKENVDCCWQHCHNGDCSRKAFICTGCVARWHGQLVACLSCWQAQGRLCIMCGEKPAQKAIMYKHSCGACLTADGDTVQRELVAEGSRKYMEHHAARQTWDGSEPAL